MQYQSQGSHPSHYPKPWPFIPFTNPSMSILLQERIPLHLLPQTLYVHDPFCLLPPANEDSLTPRGRLGPTLYERTISNFLTLYAERLKQRG